MTKVFTRGRAAAVGVALLLAAGPGCSLFDGCRDGCSTVGDRKYSSAGSPDVSIPKAPPAAVAGAASPGVYPAALK